MQITRLEELEGSKIRVYIDDEYAFLIYQKDQRLYKLTEGEEISQSLYDIILQDTVLQRAKMKALAILKFMDRTEHELRMKLIDAEYPKDIIEQVIDYLYGYRYLNDERVAASYIRAKKTTKSRLVIKTELLQKGVKREIIDDILEMEYQEEQEDPELTAIKKAIYKKTKAPEELEYDQKQKLIASLYRKGFNIGKIKQILS